MLPETVLQTRLCPLANVPPLRNKSLGIKKLDIHLDLFKLLDGLFYLEGFVLKQPQIYMVLYANGANNLNPLFSPPPIVKGKPNPKLKAKAIPQKEEPKSKKTAAAKSQPLKAQDIPLAASLGKIGIENGELELTLQQTGDKVRIQALDFLVKNIEFDPADLKNKKQC